VDLLTPIYEDDRLHPSFKRLLTARTLRSGRLQIEECSARYDDQDGNFVEQFQTTGFDARTFELYINELLFSEVFEHSDKLPYPDFHVSKNNVQIAIECTTANPTQTGKSEIEAYSPINPRDADIDDLVQRLLADAPIQIASPLFSKLNKRFKGVPYWDLPSVKGKPFILAVQTFHEDGALAFSASALAGYLYGVKNWLSTRINLKNIRVRRRPYQRDILICQTVKTSLRYYGQMQAQYQNLFVWDYKEITLIKI